MSSPFFSFELSEVFLSNEERLVFREYLNYHGLDESVWEVFDSLFRTPVSHTRPYLLKVFEEEILTGTAVILKCTRYGRTLFKNRWLAWLFDRIRIPFFLWVKFGCCADMISNPGFVAKPDREEEILKVMLQHLQNNYRLTVVHDFTSNWHQYPEASILPALPHAVIDCTGFTSLSDYTVKYKNLKKKLKVFEKKGGSYSLLNSSLKEDQISSVRQCFLSTTERSVIYMPYQDLYLNAALHTSSEEISGVYYFVASLKGQFIGYQAALSTGRHLNALHGAFDRTLKTTYHAYDILFVKMTEFALQHGLTQLDFGVVLNYTKEKMVNHTAPMSYFLLSNRFMFRKLIKALFRVTQIQGREQLKFRNPTGAN